MARLLRSVEESKNDEWCVCLCGGCIPSAVLSQGLWKEFPPQPLWYYISTTEVPVLMPVLVLVPMNWLHFHHALWTDLSHIVWAGSRLDMKVKGHKCGRTHIYATNMFCGTNQTMAASVCCTRWTQTAIASKTHCVFLSVIWTDAEQRA